MIITLTTDFGYQDHFVGVMKGVIYQNAPLTTRIIDITHNIPAQNLKKAYMVMEYSFHYFPPKTLHVIVVDPTVGSKRKIVCIEAYDQLFLAPDNGLLGFLPQTEIENIYVVENSHYFGKNISSTFHGRDIFASVAGHLANKVQPNQLGPVLEPHLLQRLTIPQPVINTETITGEIIYIDHFGNLITNISQKMLNNGPRAYKIKLANLILDKIHAYYNEVPSKSYLALINSSELLEISQRDGNAARKLGITEGTAIHISANIII